MVSFQKEYILTLINKTMKKITLQQWANISKVVLITAWSYFMYHAITTM
jgi:hypothetical protein